MDDFKGYPRFRKPPRSSLCTFLPASFEILFSCSQKLCHGQVSTGSTYKIEALLRKHSAEHQDYINSNHQIVTLTWFASKSSTSSHTGTNNDTWFFASFHNPAHLFSAYIICFVKFVGHSLPFKEVAIKAPLVVTTPEISDLSRLRPKIPCWHELSRRFRTRQANVVTLYYSCE